MCGEGGLEGSKKARARRGEKTRNKIEKRT